MKSQSHDQILDHSDPNHDPLEMQELGDSSVNKDEMKYCGPKFEARHAEEVQQNRSVSTIPSVIYI
jgi:hypothetical protein